MDQLEYLGDRMEVQGPDGPELRRIDHIRVDGTRMMDGRESFSTLVPALRPGEIMVETLGGQVHILREWG